jgi:hypothetical protein
MLDYVQMWKSLGMDPETICSDRCCRQPWAMFS